MLPVEFGPSRSTIDGNATGEGGTDETVRIRPDAIDQGSLDTPGAGRRLRAGYRESDRRGAPPPRIPRDQSGRQASRARRRRPGAHRVGGHRTLLGEKFPTEAWSLPTSSSGPRSTAGFFSRRPSWSSRCGALLVTHSYIRSISACLATCSSHARNSRPWRPCSRGTCRDGVSSWATTSRSRTSSWPIPWTGPTGGTPRRVPAAAGLHGADVRPTECAASHRGGPGQRQGLMGQARGRHVSAGALVSIDFPTERARAVVDATAADEMTT